MAPAAEKRDFLPRVESLRGIAALTVVGYHVWGGFSSSSSWNWVDAAAFRGLMALSNGIGAVVAFFVISGFVLARSLAANPDPVRYFRNRFFRLFPAAIAVVEGHDAIMGGDADMSRIHARLPTQFGDDGLLQLTVF